MLERCLRRWLLTVALLGLLPASLRAQDSVPPVAPDTLGRDSAFAPHGVINDDVDSLGRPIIRRISIHRSDVFDSTETNSFLPRLINGLHITTLEGVISRELLLQEGEAYDSAKAAETVRNLRSLGIFRSILIDTITTARGLVMRVTAKDGWTTSADVRFRSAGKQTDWQLALIERNLLGTATRFATRYRHTPDRNQLGFQFLQPRLIARVVSLGLRYETRSDGKRGQVAIERPFFSLSDKAGIETLLDIRNERVLQFRDGVGDAADSLRRKFVIGRVEAATALTRGTRGYLRVGVIGQVRKDDYVPWPQKQSAGDVYGAFGGFVEWRRANFVVTRGFQRIARDEDVDISKFARFVVLAAPEFLGYQRDGAGVEGQLRLGTRVSRSGFAWLDARANGLYTSQGLDSGSVTLGGTFVVSPQRRHNLIAHADIGWIKNPLPATEFDLGFAVGPRAFPIHAFTGNRTYFTTAEYRYIFGEDVMKALDLGIAGFVDHGGAWYDTQDRRTGTNVGIGLRLAASRGADANPTRLDLAYRFKNDQERAGWVFVIASGLVFNTTPRGL